MEDAKGILHDSKNLFVSICDRNSNERPVCKTFWHWVKSTTQQWSWVNHNEFAVILISLSKCHWGYFVCSLSMIIYSWVYDRLWSSLRVWYIILIALCLPNTSSSLLFLLCLHKSLCISWVGGATLQFHHATVQGWFLRLFRFTLSPKIEALHVYNTALEKSFWHFQFIN